MNVKALNARMNFYRIAREHELRIQGGGRTQGANSRSRRSRFSGASRPGARRPSTRRAAPGPRGAMQQVIIKTYYFTPDKRGGFVKYMQKEGKGLDGETPELFASGGKGVTDATQKDYPQEERFYKVILSPENGDKMDMKQFTQDFMKNLEYWERREFKWAAAVHYDTEKPHAHILIRGVYESGKDFEFSPNTVKYGMRGIASKIATMELGYRTELEIAQQKERDLSAGRLTQLDKEMKERAGEGRTLKPETREEKARLSFLEEIGLAGKNRNGSYTLDGRFDQKLGYLQRDGDILKTVYGKDAREKDKDFSMYRTGWKVEGEIIKKGVANEMTLKPYALIQDKSGKKYYVSDNQLEGLKEGDKIRLSPEKDGERTRTVIAKAPDRQPDRKQERAAAPSRDKSFELER